MDFQNILYRVEGAVAIVTVNRPAALNALDKLTFEELDKAADLLAADAAVRVVVLTGSGEKAFVAGADIKGLSQAPDAAGGALIARTGQAVMRKFDLLPKPVIAAVNGFALGGGLELAMCCDIRIASAKARFALPEVNLGLIPGYAGTQRLPRLVGKGMAKLMAMTGDMIGADEALRIGLVERVVPPETLMDEVLKLAATLAEKSPLSLAALKRAVGEGMDTTLDQGSALEAELFGRMFDTADMREGVGAFLEKRKPTFQGR